MLRSLAAAVAFVCVFSITFPRTAGAESPDLIWGANGIENVVCLEAIEDVDGDGGPDIVFESYDAGAPQTDHLICIRGASQFNGQVLWGTRPEGGASSGGGYGDNCMRIAPDINGDGHEDVLLGTAWGGRSAYILDGTEGDNIWHMFDTYADSPPSPPSSAWVYAMDAIRDVSGDGVPDVTFCTGNYNQGVYLMSGGDGSIIWYYTDTSDYGDPFYDARNVGDVDGDGFDDIAASSGDSTPKVLVFSGPGDGGGGPVILWELHYNDTVMSLQPFPDLDEDDLPDLVTASWDGYVRCHRGLDGTTLWTSPYLAPVVQRVAVVGDVNEDGIDDCLAGLWDNKVSMLSGLDGTVIWSQWVGTLNGGDTWAIDGCGDVNYDGVPEAVVGSFDYNVYLMDGVDGTILWEYYTGNRLLTVRGVPDLNGSGAPDVVAGTQRLSTGGKVYALEGRLASMQDLADPATGLQVHTGAELDLAPNPLPWQNAQLHWSITAPEAGDLQIQLVSPDGRLVRRLTHEAADAGASFAGRWDQRDDLGRSVETGVFWVRATLDQRLIESKRVVIVR